MHRLSLVVIALLAALVVAAAPTLAGDPPPGESADDDEIPLGAADLREMTMQALADNPELSSSPGIKAAWAYRFDETRDAAEVIYYPHTESGGMKTAFQLSCERQHGQSWGCTEASLRRYLSIESQAFEVRVMADIGRLEAIAVIEATRASIPKIPGVDPDTVYTAITLRDFEHGYTVSWHGEEAGDKHAQLVAIAVAGGDPLTASGWAVQEWEYPGCARIADGSGGYREFGAGC